LQKKQVSARPVREVAEDDLADEGDGLAADREVVELCNGARVSSSCV